MYPFCLFLSVLCVTHTVGYITVKSKYSYTLYTVFTLFGSREESSILVPVHSVSSTCINTYFPTTGSGIEQDSSRTCMTVSAYSDADWGGDHDTRRSTTGSLIMLNGNIVSWNSTRQHTVATSSTEAEYMALSDTAKDLKWFNSWLSEVLLVVPEEFKLVTPSNINVDNTAAIALTKPGAPHARTKHIDVRYHFVKEKISKGDVSITWTPTTKQLADLLTKRLPTPIFQSLVSQLLHPIDGVSQSQSS